MRVDGLIFSMLIARRYRAAKRRLDGTVPWIRLGFPSWFPLPWARGTDSAGPVALGTGDCDGSGEGAGGLGLRDRGAHDRDVVVGERLHPRLAGQRRSTNGASSSALRAGDRPRRRRTRASRPTANSSSDEQMSACELRPACWMKITWSTPTSRIAELPRSVVRRADAARELVALLGCRRDSPVDAVGGAARLELAPQIGAPGTWSCATSGLSA